MHFNFEIQKSHHDTDNDRLNLKTTMVCGQVGQERQLVTGVWQSGGFSG